VCSNSQNVKATAYAIARQTAGAIGSVYDVERSNALGEGADATVCTGKDKAPGSAFALKTIPHCNLAVKNRHDIEIMKMMNHPNIIKLHDTFKACSNTYIVMELCSGGELYDKLNNVGSIPEVQSARVMHQIFDAVRYMHDQHICHRDIKPENIMLATTDSLETNTVKVIDFGLAKTFKMGEMMNTVTGSCYYVAPQVLLGKYNHLCDMWSCGVIMYCMLCAEPPFTGDTDEEVFQKVLLGAFKFEPSAWKHVSEQARDLIRLLMKIKESDRCTAVQALSHLWSKDAKIEMPKTLLQSGLVLESEHNHDKSGNFMVEQIFSK